MSNLIKRLREDHALVYKIGWWCTIVVFILLIAEIIAEHDRILLILNWLLLYIIIFLIGSFFGIYVWCAFKSASSNNLTFGNFLEVIKYKQAFHNSKPALVIMTLISLLIILIVGFLGRSTDEQISWVIRFLTDSPGGLFGVVIGILTLIGTVVAIQSIIEMKHTITSYQQLIERVTDLIDETEDQVDGIKIVCYTPLPGFWQISSDTVKDKFQRKLLLPDRKIQIICLNEILHVKLLLTIAKIRYIDLRNNISPSKLLGFQDQCDDLLSNFKVKKGYEATPIQISWDDMPPYYFFVATHKAIVVTPVGLPLIDANIDNEICEKIANYKIPINDKKPSHLKFIKEIEKEMSFASDTILNARNKTNHAKVNTLGFETNDRTIIDLLQKLFESLKAEAEAK